MILLAADTSGQQGSLALAQCGPGEVCEILEVASLTGGTFSAQLIPQVAALLQKHGFSNQQIEAFAVVSGPGSFTGLRVGLAAFKALAEVLAKPVATVSLLEAVAVASRSKSGLAALEAGRGEVYVGNYAGQSLPDGLARERLLSLQEFLSEARGKLVVTPDATLADSIRNAGLEVEVIARPRSDAIAQLGWRKILSGRTVPPGELEANYIRRSDAEIFSKPV
jgi:tRNA threonylcarbamoyladenosine biosynthesis protein TsaB